MAQVTFDVANEMESARQQSSGNSFDFFTLRNDGDEAIVRFRYQNTSQFKIFTVHDVELVNNGRKSRRKVNCLREPRDQIDMCPLCKAGVNSRNTFLIEMIQYITDPQTGAVTVKPVVWERSMSYANRLKSLIDEYGPLDDCIFKIKRCGAAGSMDTTYEIFYGNPKMYPDNVFLKDFSAFESVNFMGSVIMSKNYDEMNTYLNTGSFPSTRTDNAQSTGGAYAANEATYAPSPSTPQYVPKEQYQPAVNTPVSQTPAPQAAPWESAPVTAPVREQYVPATPSAPAPRQYEPSTQSAPPQRATRYY